MNRLYQRLSRRASFFRSEASARVASHTVRTEVTPEQQSIAPLLSGAAAKVGGCHCTSPRGLAAFPKSEFLSSSNLTSQAKFPPGGRRPLSRRVLLLAYNIPSVGKEKNRCKT